MSMTLADMAEALATAVVSAPDGTHADQEISLVCHDSRHVMPGSLFVCIRGASSDGHDYAAQAVQSGAAALLAERNPFEGTPPVPLLIAPDSVKALCAIGHEWRKRFHGKVVGITGTAGKTTLKEILAYTLTKARQGKATVARNPLNLNTQIGLPESMLAARGDEDFWVMEAGISHPDDMDELGPTMEPDLAIILNVGAGHALGLGDAAHDGGAAHFKSRLLNYLAEGGQALVSADYPDLVKESDALREGIIRFSATGQEAPYQAEYLGLTPEGRGRCRLWLKDHEIIAESALSGPFAAESLIAAAAAAHMLGLSDEEILDGLAHAPLASQRFNRRDLPGWIRLDDSYNSNPLSSSRMVEAAAGLRQTGGRLVYVMGEMLELGDLAAESHVELGRNMARAGADAVFWYGGHADDIKKGLETCGYQGFFAFLPDHASFLPALEQWRQDKAEATAPNVILFKGSRGNRLEKLVKAFEDNHAL